MKYVLDIQGTVIKRDEANFNPNVTTGTVEVQAENVTILNEAKTLHSSLMKERMYQKTSA